MQVGAEAPGADPEARINGRPGMVGADGMRWQRAQHRRGDVVAVEHRLAAQGDDPTVDARARRRTAHQQQVAGAEVPHLSEPLLEASGTAAPRRPHRAIAEGVQLVDRVIEVRHRRSICHVSENRSRWHDTRAVGARPYHQGWWGRRQSADQCFGSRSFRTLATAVKFGSTTLAISISSAWPMKICAPRSDRP
jgi:hypothetical protein